LTSYYQDEKESYQELLPYSLKMIKRSNVGYYDFYHNYLTIVFNNRFNHENILKLEKPERDYLFFMLEKGALKNESPCQDVLIEYYLRGIVVEKNIKKADSIYKSLGYPQKYYLVNPIEKFNLSQ
jgi:hypothetical protein